MLFATPALALLFAFPVDWVLTTEEHSVERTYFHQGSITNGSNRLWMSTVPSYNLAPGKTLMYGFDWTRETGRQGWSPGGDLELEIFRTCEKHTDPEVKHWQQ